MNPHIITIQLDATTFSIDDRLMQLLQAKNYYNELSPNNLHDTFYTTFFLDGDNSNTSQTQQPHILTRLLHFLSLAQLQAQPKAFYYKAENSNQNPLHSKVFAEYPMFPFMITLGQQYEYWCYTHTLVSEQYYAHLVGMWLLQKFVESIAKVLNLFRYCIAYPGSFKEVPLQENRQLYTIFSKEACDSGITLNEHLMFSPLHTIAGIILPHNVLNPCQLCSLQNCQFRNILT